MAITSFDETLTAPLSEAVAKRADAAGGPDAREHRLFQRQAQDQLRLNRLEESTTGVQSTKLAAGGDTLAEAAAFTAFATTGIVQGAANASEGNDDVAVGQRLKAKWILNQVSHQGVDTVQVRIKIGTTVIWTSAATEQADASPFCIELDAEFIQLGATGKLTGSIRALDMAGESDVLLFETACGDFDALPTPGLSMEAIYSATGGVTSNDIDLRQFDTQTVSPAG